MTVLLEYPSSNHSNNLDITYMLKHVNVLLEYIDLLCKFCFPQQNVIIISLPPALLLSVSIES